DRERWEQYVELTYQAGIQSGHLHGEAFGVGGRADYEVYAGAVDAARADIARWTELARRSAPQHLQSAVILTGRLELLLGNAREAHRNLAPVVADLRQHGFRGASDLRALVWEIEALTDLGELEQARELATLLEQEGTKRVPAWTRTMTARARGQ